ncbi:disintegrin and metalloproteinase domain-containing protein 32-like isoform X2 [Microcebus murinus]|uniref:disintegrin and metalloproteinase domain-containing protein 32-like isoform X2 n=1 Tax=Microcebus murinus TaxID=30608 RepID=UPI003F6A9F16
MFGLMMLLAGPCGLLASRPGSQNTFIQIVVPEKIQTNINDTSERDNEQISYIIPIDERPYTVHLKQRYFVADNFMVYLYNQGSVNSHSSNIETQCYYQGNIEGYLNSVVTLSTCSGLRGILQFENVSYGIEPLEYAVEFQHLLYKLGKENSEFSIFNNRKKNTEKYPMDYNIFISKQLESDVTDLFPLYLEVHIVMDKALYDYLGSDSMIVTNKVIEIVGLVNSMFTQFKVTVVLSSLELWSDKNKISTAGEADELLHRFLEWKLSYLTLRPHDIAYLFIYRDYPYYVGATFPGKMCVTRYSAGIVLYPKEITLEAFSIIVTQLLALSMGISYDDPKKCQCSESTCIMNPDAICLQNKPQMQIRARAVCGNAVVEGNEVCDCGNADQCGPNNCCDPATCNLKDGAQCHRGACCRDCQIQAAGFECRPSRHPDCDLSEFCNGTSSECAPDVTIQNGNRCKNRRFLCYAGACADPDALCESIFGAGSHNAPTFCYEEIQIHTDRFGNCGKNSANKYIFCGWRNILCGRVVCTFPHQTPFQQDNGDVIYAYVRNHLCISLDPRLHPGMEDPLTIQIGSACDFGRVCSSKRVCENTELLTNPADECTEKCNGRGVCNSLGECNCTGGYLPPTCESLRGATRSMPPVGKGLITEKHSGKSKKRWLLGFYIFLPIIIVPTIVALAWNRLKKRFTKEEESLSSRSRSEESTHTYASTTRSESGTQADTSRSKSEGSAQGNTNRSKSQESK